METNNRHIFKKLIFKVFVLFFVFKNGALTAQFLGTSTNYSGSRSLSVNPSLMTTSYVYADVGFNLGVSAYNDFAYINAIDYYNLINGYSTSNYYVNGKRYDFGFVMDTRHKNVYEALDFNVISAMFNPNGIVAYGFFINNRVYTNGTRIPWEILEAGVVSLDDGDYINKNYKSKNAKAGLMAWSEAGIAFSTTVYERYLDKLDVGVTAKGLLGYAGVALNLNEVDKDIIDKNISEIHKLDMMAVMAAPIDYTANFTDGEQIFTTDSPVKGLGVGFDIGVTYTRKQDDKTFAAAKRPCSFPRIKYVWRLGVSLLDVGAVHFNDNARVYRFLSEDEREFDITKLEDATNFESVIDSVNMMFYGNTDGANAGTSFNMGLPSALSLQFDYNIYKNFYVNATWIQPVRFFRYSSRRAAQLVVEPRFETAFFDFTMPVTLYNYERVLLGAEARVGFLTIGSQNIVNLLGLGKSYGLDVYVAVKFNLTKERCRKKDTGACWNSDFGHRRRR